MALIIAGERSGSGKTTITLALLSVLSQRSDKVQSFKVGPDYIDPMFHTVITRRPCRNLDPLLTSETDVKWRFANYCQGMDYVLIEGVMGLFDGVHFQPSDQDWVKDYASTAHIARILKIPVVLVLDCRHLSRSVAAIASGYRTFDPQIDLAGVILNRVGSDRHLELLTDGLNQIQMPILGVFRRQDDFVMANRHLGLVPTDEIPHLSHFLDKLAHFAKRSFNWDDLYPLLSPPSGGGNVQPQNFPIVSLSPQPIKIAIARDRAFNFYYPENLELLQLLGADLAFFSPLQDTQLPRGSRGLILGGGFPEVFAADLSANTFLIQEIRQRIQAGMPTYAECGGLMYLSQGIVDFQDRFYPMIEIIPTKAIMGQKLTLGYRKMTNIQENWLICATESLWGHEFHRSFLTHLPSHPVFQLKGLSAQTQLTADGWQIQRLFASYLHLQFGRISAIAEKFYRACLAFSEKLR